ncbi:unnamed protein product [Closterium sp. Yama58-4]|nr:unnamed protein product [Closterium sp. Yama58-4]
MGVGTGQAEGSRGRGMVARGGRGAGVVHGQEWMGAGAHARGDARMRGGNAGRGWDVGGGMGYLNGRVSGGEALGAVGGQQRRVDREEYEGAARGRRVAMAWGLEGDEEGDRWDRWDRGGEDSHARQQMVGSADGRMHRLPQQQREYEQQRQQGGGGGEGQFGGVVGGGGVGGGGVGGGGVGGGGEELGRSDVGVGADGGGRGAWGEWYGGEGGGAAEEEWEGEGWEEWGGEAGEEWGGEAGEEWGGEAGEGEEDYELGYAAGLAAAREALQHASTAATTTVATAGGAGVGAGGAGVGAGGAAVVGAASTGAVDEGAAGGAAEAGIDLMLPHHPPAAAPRSAAAAPHTTDGPHVPAAAAAAAAAAGDSAGEQEGAGSGGGSSRRRGGGGGGGSRSGRRVHVDVSVKREICELRSLRPGITVPGIIHVCRAKYPHLRLTPSHVRGILHNAPHWSSLLAQRSSKCVRAPENMALEEALVAWVRDMKGGPGATKVQLQAICAKGRQLGPSFGVSPSFRCC